MRSLVWLPVLLGFIFCASAGASEYEFPVGQENFACIVYPAFGNIDTQEGTFELWVRNDFDPVSKISNLFYSPMTYLNLLDVEKNHSYLVLGTRSASGGKAVYPIVGDVADGIDPTTALVWRSEGEWHFLAMTRKLDGGRYTVKLFKDFDYARAEFHPYYREEGLVDSGDPENVLCAIYLHRGERALVVPGNVGNRDVTPHVKFDWEKLGMSPSSVEVHDALLPHINFAKEGDRYAVPIQPQRYRVLLLTGQR